MDLNGKKLNIGMLSENKKTRKTPPRLESVELGVKWFRRAVEMRLFGVKTPQWDNEKVIYEMVDWAFMMEKTEINYNKGILLKGQTGRGKTFLMEILKSMLELDDYMYLTIINAKKVAAEYQSGEGYKIIDKYAKCNYLVLDDIGSEAVETKSYGNALNIVEEIITEREKNNMLTFGTTNLNKLSDRYDDRIVSRMNELFNVRSLNHDNDYRRL